MAFFGDTGGNFFALDTATGHDYGTRISAAPLAATSSLIPQVARRRWLLPSALPTFFGRQKLRPGKS